MSTACDSPHHRFHVRPRPRRRPHQRFANHSPLPASIPRVLRSMNVIHLLCLFIGAASAFTMGLNPKVTAPRMAAIAMIEPVESTEDCMASAETGAEAEECVLPLADAPAPARSKSLSMKPTSQEQRKNLMGNADSLDQCLSEAENGAEIAECELDYDVRWMDRTHGPCSLFAALQP